ncbi:MAG: hypothetical protein PHU69_06435 [Fermentimonas sp.]|nr:hypothetical protein [Fermentimonas sp.]
MNQICYQTDSISASIKDFAELGFMAISKVDSTPAIEEKRVVLMFHKRLDLIELVEN